MTTWKTYNWDVHSSGHYKYSESLQGCILVQPKPDGNRVGLIKIPGIDGWHLPHGSHEKDSDTDLYEVAMRALRNHFTDGAQTTLDHLHIGTGSDHVIYDSRKVTWTEEALNDHIRDCESRGTRPFWNRPGTAYRDLFLYGVNVSDEDVTALKENLKPNVVEKIRFFYYDELIRNTKIDKCTKKALKNSPLFRQEIVAEFHDNAEILLFIFALFTGWLFVAAFSPY